MTAAQYATISGDLRAVIILLIALVMLAGFALILQSFK